MKHLAKRSWVPLHAEQYIQQIAQDRSVQSSEELCKRIAHLADQNRTIHERECFNLNPATNVMNPKAEALLASGMGTRPSLGYPGDKYEMGLEAIEEIEVIAAELAAEIFDAKYAEIRVPSGAIANLYAFMALCKPGDHIIVPPATVGGHVTHHLDGCAGLYGLVSHAAPVDTDGYTIDIDGLRDLAQTVKPKVITIGGSLNLLPHPIKDIRAIADDVGSAVLFDAAHQCGIIAGGVWENPLVLGADVMTMSTYKSLGGPPSGLIVTNNEGLAERLDKIAFPGMTANFDASKSAALAVSLLDWRDHGKAYAQRMIELSISLAKALMDLDIDVFQTAKGPTASHQFAIIAAPFGGGQAASKTLRKGGFLACGIGLPIAEISGDLNGLRMGTPELARWGMRSEDMPQLAKFIATALRANNPTSIAKDVADWRKSFNTLHFMNQS